MPISRATIDSTGKSVTLSTVLLPGASYTLSVWRIRDRAVAANEIASGSGVSFTASQFAVTNIGAFGAGTAIATNGGYDISASGADIGGTSDSFGFHARVYVGDFDVQTRVEALDLSDGYSEAGLMARPQGSTNSAFAAVLSSPSLAGVKFQSRATTGAQAANAGFMPVNHPYTWLRLQRVGDAFTGFGSFDGQMWQTLGSASITMPSSVFVGFAVSSHQTNLSAVAKFREPTVAAGGTIVSSVTLPFEPLGPSSRRTGLVISEIMYHPADVPGLTNSARCRRPGKGDCREPGKLVCGSGPLARRFFAGTTSPRAEPPRETESQLARRLAECTEGHHGRTASDHKWGTRGVVW